MAFLGYLRGDHADGSVVEGLLIRIVEKDPRVYVAATCSAVKGTRTFNPERPTMRAVLKIRYQGVRPDCHASGACVANRTPAPSVLLDR